MPLSAFRRQPISYDATGKRVWDEGRREGGKGKKKKKKEKEEEGGEGHHARPGGLYTYPRGSCCTITVRMSRSWSVSSGDRDRDFDLDRDRRGGDRDRRESRRPDLESRFLTLRRVGGQWARRLLTKPLNPSHWRGKGRNNPPALRGTASTQ